MHAHNAFARSSPIEQRAARIFAVNADNLLASFGVSEATAPEASAGLASSRAAGPTAPEASAGLASSRAAGGLAASPRAGIGAPAGNFAASAASRASPWLGCLHIVIFKCPGASPPGNSPGKPPPKCVAQGLAMPPCICILKNPVALHA